LATASTPAQPSARGGSPSTPRRGTPATRSGCTATCCPGNLLVVDGRLSAVIDFGGLNVGHPACDLQPAWNLFAGDSRRLFRARLEVDDASWLRGRGWALYQAVTALGYYWDTNPGMVRQASHTLAQVLAGEVPAPGS
jgi:aminoglycoside phosphotransferase (APT) family kinase protein